MNEEHTNETTNIDTPVEQQDEQVTVQGVKGDSKKVVIWVVISIVVVVLALMYMWGSSIEQGKMKDTTMDQKIEDKVTVPTDQMEPLSTSDDIEAIENDLDTTELSDLDGEFNAIESELDQMLVE